MKQKSLLRSMLLLFALVVGVESAWAEDKVYKTALFGSSYNSTSISTYTDTWTATNNGFTVSLANFNNNNNNWNYVKCGRKNIASVATITTSASIDKAITKVVVTIDALTASKVNSIKLYTSSNNSSWTEAGSFAKETGAQTVTLASAATNLYYKVEFDCASGSSNGLVQVSKVEYYYSESGQSTLEANDLALENAPVALSFDLYNNSAAQTIRYTTSSTGAVTVSASDYVTTAVDKTNTTITVTPTAVTPETQTITVNQAADETYAAGSVTFTVTITNSDPNQPGSENKPYTVAEARAAIDANSGVTGVYATGIVSEIVTAYNSQYGNISYNISADGLTTSDQLQAYRGKSYNGANFTSEDDIQVGDIVVVYGNLKKYNSTYEFDANNQLVSLKRAGVANLVFEQESYTVGVGGNLTITATSSDSDGDITYSSSNTDVADIDATTGVVTAKAEGTTTITATIAATDELKGTTATVELTVTDNRAEAGLAWSEEEVNIELNATEYTLPTLTNPNNLTVTYSSSNENVANVVEGEVLVVTSAEGTATITATFAGNNEFKSGSASYTINIIDPNQKGTEDNPYTVQDLIDMDGTAATTENVYVIGWVAGYLVSNTNLNTNNPSSFSVSNIAIADNPNETEISKVVSASFQNNSARAALNLKDNPWNVGVARVLLYGKLGKAFGKVGLTTVLVASKKVAEYVTVSSVGYATYSTDVALDFSETNITVNTAKANGTSVALSEVANGIVPANTGVVLTGNNVKAIVPVVESNATLSENEMKPNVARALVAEAGDGGKSNYILSNETAGVGFYLAAENGAYLPAHRAYLSTTATATGNAPFLGFEGGETTAIQNIQPSTLNTQQYYDLSGRRVAQPTKGLYIVNGKKVLVP